MSFSDLKARIKSRGRPSSSKDYVKFLGAFSKAEHDCFIASQRIVTQGLLTDNLEGAVEAAMRLVIHSLDYSPEEAADFLRLGKDLMDHLPDRPDVFALMVSSLNDEDMSQTRH